MLFRRQFTDILLPLKHIREQTSNQVQQPSRFTFRLKGISVLEIQSPTPHPKPNPQDRRLRLEIPNRFMLRLDLLKKPFQIRIRQIQCGLNPFPLYQMASNIAVNIQITKPHICSIFGFQPCGPCMKCPIVKLNQHIPRSGYDTFSKPLRQILASLWGCQDIRIAGCQLPSRWTKRKCRSQPSIFIRHPAACNLSIFPFLSGIRISHFRNSSNISRQIQHWILRL